MKINRKYESIIGIVIIILCIIAYFIIKNRVVEVKLVEIKQIEKKIKFNLNGEIVARDVEFLHKKVRMKVKNIFAIPGTKVKKGDLLISFYGVTKDGYDETLDPEVREELNEKIILLDSLKKDLKELRFKEKVLKEQLDDAKEVERVMRELVAKNRGVSSEVNSAKDAVMYINLEYQKVLKDISILEKTIMLKSIVIEKELEERSKNTVAPKDGIIVSVDVKNGENVIPAHTLVTFADKDTELDAEFYIPKLSVNDIRIGDKVKVAKFNNKKELTETTGEVYKLSEIETKLEENGLEFNGLIGRVALDDYSKFQINDQVEIGVVKTEGKYGGGISTFSVFDISKDKKTGYVYVIEDGKAKKKEVTLGRNIDHQYEILNMPIGTLIIGNPYKLKEGKKVIVIE